jgi:hypothetical protein
MCERRGIREKKEEWEGTGEEVRRWRGEVIIKRWWKAFKYIFFKGVYGKREKALERSERDWMDGVSFRIRERSMNVELAAPRQEK